MKKKVGILGTSANPLHAGHVEIALSSLRQLGLDEVIFMVTPHNPVKDPLLYAPIEHRLHLAHLEAAASGFLGKGLKVSEFEVLLHHFDVENATAVMLERFTTVYPNLQPVWLMGADNLVSLHTWGSRWQDIIERYSVGVFPREGSNEAAERSVAATQFAALRREPETFTGSPGTWCFLHPVSHVASSSEIRTAILRGENPKHISQESVDYIRQHELLGYQKTDPHEFS